MKCLKTLRACLFGEILERMKNLSKKSGEKEVLVVVWLGEREKKKVIGSWYFLLKLIKMFSPKLGKESNLLD